MPARPGTRILVVDDASCFRQAARELLERRGYGVVGEAACAASAREALTRLAPEGVLLDVNLPDGNGVELAAEFVRSRPALAVLLVSARPVEDGQGSDSPARGFVLKSQLAKTDLTRFWPHR